MMRKLITIVLLFFIAVFSTSNLLAYIPPKNDQLKMITQSLADAQKKEDYQRVKFWVYSFNQLLGKKTGVPDIPEEYEPVPNDLPLFPSSTISKGFEKYRVELNKNAWWKNFPGSKDCPTALRSVSSVIEGTLHAREAGCENPDALLQIAREAGDYLLYTQRIANTGVYPMPDLRGRGGRLDDLITRFFQDIEQKGLLDQAVKDGWIIEDFETGDMFFDHGLCGFSLLELYEATGDLKYLNSVLWAEQWLDKRPSVPNWNYNSFCILFLSRLAKVTGNQTYLEKALKRTKLGLLPGQLTKGINIGRWNDPHNAKMVYHLIIIRSLIELNESIQIFTKTISQADQETCRNSLTVAMNTRLSELTMNGISHPDILTECFSRIVISKDLFPSLYQDKIFQEIWHSLCRYIFKGDNLNKPYLSPASRGYFLEAVKKYYH